MSEFSMKEICQEILMGYKSRNIGPNSKEIFLFGALDEYCSGNIRESIFFQQRALFQAYQDYYFQTAIPTENANQLQCDKVVAGSNKDRSKFEKKSCDADQVIKVKEDKAKVLRSEIWSNETQYVSCDYLFDIEDPSVGAQKIADVCQEFPKEWTILQLVKGPCVESTYLTYEKLHQLGAPIFLTVLRHARSDDIPNPICFIIEKPNEQVELYKQFGTLSTDFRNAINVDPKDYHTAKAKDEYWKTLNELNDRIGVTVTQFRKFFYPWKFLFTGIPTSPDLDKYKTQAFQLVDKLCEKYNFGEVIRVFLSLVALHINLLSEEDVDAVLDELFSEVKQKHIAQRMLRKLSAIAPVVEQSSHFPCILVVDERLDHFFWEELNVEQEFTRVSSMQALFSLYNWHKDRIHSGYLHVDVAQGACLINPESDLVKSEMRLKSFFNYWTPHWHKIICRKPTQQDLENLFSYACYVYAGHSSGLQYLSGKRIAQLHVKSVVFLFGCDSSRLRSNGFNSELLGPHLYYHAAKCPTMVGTILPGLDANMDTVATEVLSHWIAPNSKEVLPWHKIDRLDWVKTGTIKCQDATGKTPTLGTTPGYFLGSLGAVIAQVHQRKFEKKYYNTVAYIIRGLPVWNTNVEKFPYEMQKTKK